MRTTHFQRIFYLSLLTCFVYQNPTNAQGATAWSWPDGKKAALSLSFDDEFPTIAEFGEFVEKTIEVLLSEDD